MTIHALFICLFSLVIFVSIGCDRVKEIVSKSPVSESREILVESLIERLVEKNKQQVEEAHKKGETKTVRFVDGNRWLDNSFYRVGYIEGVADLVGAILGTGGVVSEDVGGARQQSPTLESVALDAYHSFLWRVSRVTNGRPFGDTIVAVTKFYLDKPLLKDRPVIWVLAVPLYKQLQEAKPPDQRNNEYDTVLAPIKKK